MSDRIIICTIPDMKLPVGTPVTFQGNIVGKVLDKHEIMINNDMVSSLIKRNEAKFSLEVSHK